MNTRNQAGTQIKEKFPSYTAGSHKPRKRQARWFTILCLGMLLASLTIRANADTTMIYFYSNGSPENVTGVLLVSAALRL